MTSKKDTKPQKTKKPAGKPAKGRELKPEVSVQGDLITVTIKFKHDSNGGHNHVIVDNIDDNHVSVGLSTKPKKGKNSPNYALEISPLLDGKTSFMRRQGTVAPKKSYRKPRQGKMAEKDLERAKGYGEKAKQKYIEKKRKKNNDVPNT